MSDQLGKLKTACADRNTIERELGSGGGFVVRLLTAVVLAIACTGVATFTQGAPIEREDSDLGDPSDMMLIPGGEFMMGSDTDGDHKPAHRVKLGSFYIDAHEVTNAEYFEFCQATGHRLPEFWGIEARRSGPDYPHHPVVGVSWQDAADYARWRGKRLPTEAEWEYAARGGLASLNYPGSDTLNPRDANYTESDFGHTVEVGSYPPNGYGLHDMSGNVFEWVADRYGADYYSRSPLSNPRGPDTGRFRVIRGGGWHSGSFCNRTYYRNALPPQWVDFAVGFRCARDAGEELREP
jgi:formylglycine-generating enzyme required for sulfatase activity